MEDARSTARKHRPEALVAVEREAETLPDDYDERPVESLQEMEELVRLRAELTWADWKAHKRFKKDRVIREAQRRMGVPAGDAPVVPRPVPANDVAEEGERMDVDAELSGDEVFSTVCDARRDAWIEALEATGDECD